MQKNIHTASACEPHTGPADTGLSRQNYYFGKMLTARDFQAEQHYLNEKRWLINRSGIGWGVVCGLEVVPHCTSCSKVSITPGLALDAYGNEIILSEPHCIDLKTACRNDTTHEQAQQEQQETPSEADKYYIIIRYQECQTEPSPIPVEECGEYQTHCFYNRTRETYRIEVSRQQPELPKSPRQELAERLQCETECFEFLSAPAAVTTADCPSRKKDQPTGLTLSWVNKLGSEDSGAPPADSPGTSSRVVRTSFASIPGLSL